MFQCKNPLAIIILIIRIMSVPHSNSNPDARTRRDTQTFDTESGLILFYHCALLVSLTTLSARFPMSPTVRQCFIGWVFVDDIRCCLVDPWHDSFRGCRFFFWWALCGNRMKVLHWIPHYQSLICWIKATRFNRFYDQSRKSSIIKRCNIKRVFRALNL